MPSGSYSFIDIAALEAVRESFAKGDALAVLAVSLDRILWANGPGAAVFGYPDVEAVIDASPRLTPAARRQIMSVAGFPDIDGERTLLVRIATGVDSRALAFAARTIRLPHGESAILLAVRDARSEAMASQAVAERAISGFSEPGRFIALIGADGTTTAASQGFERLGVAPSTLSALAKEIGGGGDRVVKRILLGGDASYPAGFARLVDDPPLHLLVVVDEGGEVRTEPSMVSGEAIAPLLSSVDQGEAAPEAPAEGYDPEELSGEDESVDREPTLATKSSDAQAERGANLDEWYFSPGASGTGPDGPSSESLSSRDDVVEGDAEANGVPTLPSGPVRFVWRTDADGSFAAISSDFAALVGAPAADVIGRRFADIANAFALDPSGEIAGLLERRDTWSGRSVLWPISGTEWRLPVDLAALPVYARDRTFEGFRGFGVARPGEAELDPEGIGRVLVAGPPLSNNPDRIEPAADKAKPADPFQGEVPALTITPKRERRFADKVIRLAEHGEAANDKGLSPVERNAFREIGERLKSDTGAITGNAVTEAEDTGEPSSEHVKSEEVLAGPERVGAEAAQPFGGERSKEVEPPTAGPPEFNPARSDEGGTSDGIKISNKPGDLEGTRGDASSHTECQQPFAVERFPLTEPQAPTPLGERSNDADFDPRPDAQTTEIRYDQPSRQDEPDASSPVAEFDEAAADSHLSADGASEPGGSDANAASFSVENTDSAAAPPGEPASAVLEQDSATLSDPASAEPVQATPTTIDDPATDPLEPAEAPNEPELATVGSPAAAAEIEKAPSPIDPLPEFEPRPRAPVDTSILDRLPVPVLIHAGDILHYANPAFLELTAYASVEHLAEAGGLGLLFSQSVGDEDESDRTLRLRTGDGVEFPIEALLRSVPWNGRKALMLVVRRTGDEIAASGQAHGRAVLELQGRLAEMRTIIDTATDGVVLIAPDGAIRSISRPAEALFGFDSDEAAGKPFASLFAIESQRAARDYLSGLADHGVASVLNDGREVIGREAKGRFIPLFMTLGKLPGDSGYCAVVRDITQWKRAEEELTHSRTQAERASSLKSDFLARVSHEIRTPLNAIIGFSELMVDEKFGPVANDRYRDYLRDINKSGNHVLDLVNDLLDISKIEAGQQEMAYEAVSLNDTLAETVAMMQPQANRERVIIRSSFASRLPEVVADLRSLRQIALNILSNAVRYTQAGGQVIVSTSYELTGDIVLRVRDTGIGMTQAEIEQALKPFKQLNTLKRTRGDGTGLGLPLTKAMVEANRATFSIQSTPGEGTLVEVIFPSTRVLAH